MSETTILTVVFVPLISLLGYVIKTSMKDIRKSIENNTVAMTKVYSVITLCEKK